MAKVSCKIAGERGTARVITVSYHQRASAGKALNTNKGQEGETIPGKKGRPLNLNCIAQGSQVSWLPLSAVPF